MANKCYKITFRSHSHPYNERVEFRIGSYYRVETWAINNRLHYETIYSIVEIKS